MTPIDDQDRELGKIEGRINGMHDSILEIKQMLLRWEDQHSQCKIGMDARMRRCEETRAQAIAVGGVVGFLAGISSWIKDLLR
jgi:hypothetical protein